QGAALGATFLQPQEVGALSHALLEPVVRGGGILLARLILCWLLGRRFGAFQTDEQLHQLGWDRLRDNSRVATLKVALQPNAEMDGVWDAPYPEAPVGQLERHFWTIREGLD